MNFANFVISFLSSSNICLEPIWRRVQWMYTETPLSSICSECVIDLAPTFFSTFSLLPPPLIINDTSRHALHVKQRDSNSIGILYRQLELLRIFPYSLQMLPGIKHNFFLFSCLHFRSNKNVKSFLHRFSWHDNNACKSHFSTFIVRFFVVVVVASFLSELNYCLSVETNIDVDSQQIHVKIYDDDILFDKHTRLCLLWKSFFFLLPLSKRKQRTYLM